MNLPTIVIFTIYLLSVAVDSVSYERLNQLRFSNHTGVTTVPPCCGDSIGILTCKRLFDRDPLVFQRRCQSEPDFSMIQCCNSCGLEDAPERYAKFFDAKESENCFDRRSPDFCQKFLDKTNFWSGSIWSCSGIHANLAFRVCRRTCGYCRKDLFSQVDGYYQPTPCGIQPEFTPYAKKTEMYKKHFWVYY